MTKSTNPLDFVADMLDSVAARIEESIKNSETPKPEQKEASNTTTGGIEQEEVEILNPFSEAQRVLGKVEEVAEDLHDDAKAAALLEVAKVHTEIGRQLLDSFDF